jgi:hypothetical protein
MNAPISKLSRRLRQGLLASLATIAVLTALGAATPALADIRHDRPEAAPMRWREHERRAREWHHGHPVPVPEVVYAPPPVVYAPPPPSPGINLVIPLDIR